MITIQEHSEGYIISLGRGRFVKTSFGLRSPVKVWKTRAGVERYINKKYGLKVKKVKQNNND